MRSDRAIGLARGTDVASHRWLLRGAESLGWESSHQDKANFISLFRIDKDVDMKHTIRKS